VLRGRLKVESLLGLRFWSNGIRLSLYRAPFFVLLKDVYFSKAEAKEALKKMYEEKIKELD